MESGWSPGREKGGGGPVVLSEENTHNETEVFIIWNINIIFICYLKQITITCIHWSNQCQHHQNILIIYLFLRLVFPGSARGSWGTEGENPWAWGLLINKYISNDFDYSYHCFRTCSSLPTGHRRKFLGIVKNVPRIQAISATNGITWSYIQRRISNKHQSFPRIWRERVKTFLLTLRIRRSSRRRWSTSRQIKRSGVSRHFQIFLIWHFHPTTTSSQRIITTLKPRLVLKETHLCLPRKMSLTWQTAVTWITASPSFWSNLFPLAWYSSRFTKTTFVLQWHTLEVGLHLLQIQSLCRLIFLLRLFQIC